jgi:cell division septation protein DedD
MEEQASWKGHSFTLMVFTGIVVLCSIFFILGMLVGRTQGQKIAAAAAEEATAKAAETETEIVPEEKKPELTFYESVDNQSQSFEPAIAAKPALETPKQPDPPVVAPSPKPATKPANAPPTGSAVNYQIAALSKYADAEKLVTELKKKSFRAFILTPGGSDGNRLFRVQVGPFRKEQEAELVKRQLEAAGYKPIVKR